MAFLECSRKMGRARSGQALVELTLGLPLLLLLLLGAIEFSNMIYNHLVLTHLTREGANLTSRGTDPDVALDTVISVAKPVIQIDSPDQWKVVYSQIGQDPAVPCPPTPCVYRVDEQLSRGGLEQGSRIGSVGARVEIPGIDNIGPGQAFHAVEVFYDYGPSRLTSIENLLGTIGETFYERTIFTDAS